MSVVITLPKRATLENISQDLVAHLYEADRLLKAERDDMQSDELSSKLADEESRLNYLIAEAPVRSLRDMTIKLAWGLIWSSDSSVWGDAVMERFAREMRSLGDPILTLIAKAAEETDICG